MKIWDSVYIFMFDSQSSVPFRGPTSSPSFLVFFHGDVSINHKLLYFQHNNENQEPNFWFELPIGQLLIYLSLKQFIQVEMCGSILHGDWLSRNIYLFWNRRSKSLSWILTCYMTKLNLKFNFPNNSILGTVQTHMIYIVGCWGVVQLGGQILVSYKSLAQAWIVLLMELNSIRLIGLLVKYEKYETLSINYE